MANSQQKGDFMPFAVASFNLNEGQHHRYIAALRRIDSELRGGEFLTLAVEALELCLELNNASLQSDNAIASQNAAKRNLQSALDNATAHGGIIQQKINNAQVERHWAEAGEEISHGGTSND